jgi:hypothetical protein
MESLRPKGLPAALGLASENMAHRVAIRYPKGEGMHDGDRSVSGQSSRRETIPWRVSFPSVAIAVFPVPFGETGWMAFNSKRFTGR